MDEQEIHANAPHEDVSPVSKKLERWVMAILIVFIGFGITYAWMEHRSAEDMAASRDQMRAELNQTRAQLEGLTTKLNAARNAEESANASLAAHQAEHHAPATAQSGTATRAGARRRTGRADDPRWKKVEGQLADQQKMIADSQKQIQAQQENLQKTRSELEGNISSTRDELNGSIARNHEELVALQRKGERNFYEFDLPKSKEFRPSGPLSIKVRKTNTKNQFCDLEIVVNDNKLTQKHVNLYQPVLFYPEGYAQALELVVNKIGKDLVHGYVSEPKYKPEMTSTSPTASTTSGSNPSTAASATTSQVSLPHRTGEPQ